MAIEDETLSEAPDLSDMFEEASAADAAGEESEAEQPDEGSADEIEIDETETDNSETDEETDAETSVSDDSEEPGDVWNWEDHSDQMVPIVRDGETRMVSIAQLRNEGMMHADYTRKTQELSEVTKRADWANAVQNSFERDPQGTLQALAQAYGVTADGPQPQGDVGNNLEELDEDVRPWAERTLQAQQQNAALEQRLISIENDRIKADIQLEVAQMKTEFGDDFDPVATLNYAADNGVSLQNAHWAVYGQRQHTNATQKAVTDEVTSKAVADAQADADAKRIKAKEKAASSTSGSFKASDIEPDDFDTIGELAAQIMAAEGS